MDNLYNKIESNIPLLDNVIYYTKILVFESVIKDQELADSNETLESIRNSDMYISCIEKTCYFDMFEYTKDQLYKVGLYDDIYYNNKYNIPENKRKELMEIARIDFINNYVEYNNYYRMLNGLPDIGDEGIYIDYIDDIPPKYLHEMNKNEIELLSVSGILDDLKSYYPEKKYLNYLNIKIDIYFARKSDKFSLLYYPTINVPEVVSRFLTSYNKIRSYTLIDIYNEAFKYGSDYYDNFIMILIKVQVIVDMLSNIADYIIKRDLFDIKSIKYMFESNGITFFEEIPLRYQILMLKNMNTLIKFKSTTKNMIDICSIFGFNNIELFKYYILKERNIDKDGNFIFEYKEEEDVFGNKILVEDVEKNNTLKFVKVPIDDNIDDYIRNEINYENYDAIVKNDIYWNGNLDPDEVKRNILEQEFNYMRSKYMSIDTVYQMDKLTFELTYFFNMIFDTELLEESLMLKVLYIDVDRTFKLKDIIFYLYLLTYEQNNLKDNIFNTATKVMHVLGFNFKADLELLSNYVNSKGFTLTELGIDFEIPNSSILTPNQLLDIFIKNKKCHDHILEQMKTTSDKKIYDIYKYIYDSLMITEINDKLFRLSDGTIAKTYTDYFKDKDETLYMNIMSIRELEGKEKENKIFETISSIVYTLDDYINTDEFTFLFTNIPSISTDIVRTYMLKVINFFKSYKIQLLNINTIYKFDDKLLNKVFIFDKIDYNLFVKFKENYKINDKSYFDIIMNLKDKITYIDYILLAYVLDIGDPDIYKILDNMKYKALIKDNDFNDFIFKYKILLKSYSYKYDYIDINDIMLIETTYK